MPSLVTSSLPFSPAELSFIHSSLTLLPPIRPDGRTSRQFRPLTAETGVLPAVNGSAHVGFEDGSEALVGIKAEVEKTKYSFSTSSNDSDSGHVNMGDAPNGKNMKGQQDWVSLSLDISGTRDDDPTLAFLSEMLREALVAGNVLPDRLVINSRWHWKLYVDILLLSQFSRSSLPLPLLSLTTHVALLSTRLPRLKSEEEEDPLFDDDWEASQFLYPRSQKASAEVATVKPPITLLTAQVGKNVIFDPSREELAVAESVIAVSIGPTTAKTPSPSGLSILAVRMIDSAARDTFPGVPRDSDSQPQGTQVEGVWSPPKGGIKRPFLKTIMSESLDVAAEIMRDLKGFAG